MTTVTFRRLLALLTVLTPTALLHRSEEARAGTATMPLSSAETVFRHYV